MGQLCTLTRECLELSYVYELAAIQETIVRAVVIYIYTDNKTHIAGRQADILT